MTDNYQYVLSLKALRDVQAELGQLSNPGVTVFPGLSDALEKIGALPSNALLVGIAADGLPVLLHLNNPRPGPILVIGDQGSGKTGFLKALIRASSLLTQPGSIRFSVLTDFPEEWDRFEAPGHLSGVWSACTHASAEMLFDLARFAQRRVEHSPILLLMDGLDSILHMDSASRENFAYLLTHGPVGGVWPIVTVNSARALKLPEWLALFRTRIYGRISHPETGEQLTPIPGAPIRGLFSGCQFCLREKSRWLQFWLPGMSN